MARFPFYRQNIQALGRLIAEARLDENKRKALIDNPKKYLAEIGLPEKTTELMSFAVIDDPDRKSVALPYKLDTELVRSDDSSYLGSLGAQFQRAH
ncbi:hypothetical protein E1180_21105 [Roseibium denhamense]|uniref:Uncharacterized protein n=1 Tax=Roseibium denhamense TaxID=76305 RepID=A0ABY1NRM6_9HYPH|nr:hypothetical protein [Roseibium denhamense]MTI08005.1 hypothetical protein [Roseibium denhamense]SMP15577.1 hypothetical protein SAMN06265374_1590 [Roseibium denhamense]